MSQNKDRRDFLKTGAMFSIGSLVLDNSLLALMSQTQGLLPIDKSAPSFRYDVMRAKDMLFIRLYLFNAKDYGTYIEPAEKNFPTFMYVQLPPQHVTEELVIDKHAFTGRDKITKKKSFLADSSWLGLKLMSKISKLDVSEAGLLNWQDNFSLVTLDDFAFPDSSKLSSYNISLASLKTEMQQLEKLNQTSLFNNLRTEQQDAPWPLTTFEVPYKMFLSPIGEPDPVKKNETEKWSRIKGEYAFSSGKNPVKLEDYGKGPLGRYIIIQPWQNQLLFEMPDGRRVPPRMKVVHWLCQDAKDKDPNVNLLPYPMHREELHHLTMLQQFDRDVLTEHFRFSSIGATTNLLYKNGDPCSYSIIAWEQRILEAKDNYISVTVRAVDYFTGLKLRISIIGERDYAHKVSFIPKRYHVAYDEPEKIYDDKNLVSRLPFVKIVPVSKGGYFYPSSIPLSSSTKIQNAYAADQAFVNDQTTYDPNRLLQFEYLCYDKDNKESRQIFRMLFIPAETYHILTDITKPYKYYENGILKGSYHNKSGPIPFQHTGLLNPSRQQKYQNGNLPTVCVESTGDEEYWYQMVKTFGIKEDQKKALATTMKNLGDHVAANEQAFSSRMENEISFARLENMKRQVVDGKSINNEVRTDSSNATFPTNALLLGSGLNIDLYTTPPIQKRDCNSSEVLETDLFLEKFPLLPSLIHAHVIISQIDKIEGRSVYRKVSYAKDYADGKVEIDELNSNNKVKLLFEIATELTDFFSNNYRSAGACVNTGIDIRFISVLDQGITYNESHNIELAAFANKSRGDLKSAGIFKPLKAEIFGIPLTAILEDVLPVSDLPIFTFAQQARDGLNELQSTIQKNQEFIKQWKKAYEDAEKNVTTYLSEVKKYEAILKKEPSKQLRAWIESIIDLSTAKLYFEELSGNLNNLSNEYKSYKNKVLTPIQKGLKVPKEITDALNALAAIPGRANAKKVFEKLDEHVQSQVKKVVSDLPRVATQQETANATAIAKEKGLRHIKEIVKTYLLLADQAKLQLDGIRESIGLLGDDIQLVHNEVYRMMRNSVSEAQELIALYAEQQKKLAVAKFEEKIGNILESVMEGFPNAINKEFMQAVATLNQVATVYKQYYRLYKNLSREDYTILAKELGITMPVEEFISIEKQLVVQFRNYVDNIKVEGSVYKNQINSIKEQYIKILNENSGDLTKVLREFESISKEPLSTIIKTALAPFLEKIEQVDKLYEDTKYSLNESLEKLRVAEKTVRDFAKNMIEQCRTDLNKKIEEFKKLSKENPQYVKVKNEIEELNRFLKKIQEFSKQKLDYTFTTQKFRQASFAGVIDFIPGSRNNKTSLDVKVCYELEFNISAFDSPPSIKKQSFRTESTLTDFKIGFLQLLFIDFEKVKFISGSDVRDDFQVNIRNVEFAGPLSFVSAFQDYLKSIDNNLVFDIDASGARIGYGIRIPDITAGYFNFFNLSLAALLTLPFDPKKSLQLQFGLGSELSKFGITVSGIFGGQGYFNLIAEPKLGIVGMVLVLEFGAIFNLNLGVAWGNAYLVGGIYIRRYNGLYIIKAYILCVGRFNVLGIFSSSITFYLGLEGNGPVLVGRCVVKVSKKFSKWFTLEVKVGMKKTLIAGKKTEQSAEKKFISVEDKAIINQNGVTEVDTNLGRGYIYSDEAAFVTFTVPDKANIASSLKKNGKNVQQNLVSIEKSEKGPAIAFITIDSNNILETGSYELIVHLNGVDVGKKFEVINTAFSACKEEYKALEMSDSEYYGSYYQF